MRPGFPQSLRSHDKRPADPHPGLSSSSRPPQTFPKTQLVFSLSAMIVPASKRVTLTSRNRQKIAKRRLTLINKIPGMTRLTRLNCAGFSATWLPGPGRRRLSGTGEAPGRRGPSPGLGDGIRQIFDTGRIFIAKGEELC
jgi:hypothetical protein